MKRMILAAAIAAILTVAMSALLLSQDVIVQKLPEKTIGGIVMVKIPAGDFIMGSPEGVGKDNEHPQHKVNISSFWISKYEVTQKQYQRVMGKNPSYLDIYGEIMPTMLEGTDTSSHPVVNLTWLEAVKYCNALSKKCSLRSAYKLYMSKELINYDFGPVGVDFHGIIVDPVVKTNGFRLPTEAEWEYACRAGTTTKYYWGDTINSDYVWWEGNSKTTHPVGMRKPNQWGLYDMSGNVEEWCWDMYDENYYKTSPANDPKGPKYRWELNHVWRGGSFFTFGDSVPESSLCSTSRQCASWVDTKGDSVGFRVVISASQD